MDTDDIEQVRTTARRLAERIQMDPAFKEEVEKDPEGVLTGEGLPQEAVGDFLRETGLGDVSGYIAGLHCRLSVY